MSVGELRDKGAEAWKQGAFEQAVECFGKAIDADGGENRSGQLKELLSNRSAARLKARDGEDADGAVADAERCVVLDGAWAKGHARLGAALLTRGRRTDAARAVGAYSCALELEPANAAARDGLERATLAVRAGAVPLSARFGAFLHRERARVTAFMLRGAFALAALVYVGASAAGVLSALGLSTVAAAGELVELVARRARLGALIALLLARALDLLAAVPARRTGASSLAHAADVMQLADAQAAFYCLLCLVVRARVLVLVPLVLRELAPTARFAAKVARELASPAFARQAGRTARETLLPFHAVIARSGAAPATRAEYARLSADAQARVAVDALERLSALAELALGLVVALELVIPAARSFISVIAYWQYLQMRVVLERQTRGGPTLRAFGLLDARLLTLSARSTLLSGGYARLRAILVVMSSPSQSPPGGPPPTGASAPVRPRCAVM